MRRAAALVGAAALVLAVVPIAARMSADRRADAWFADDPDTVLRLADQLAASMAEGTHASDFSTGDARFDGEWALVSCQMTTIALGGLLPTYPDREAAWRPAIHTCATWLATAEARAFGTAAWGEDGALDVPEDHVHAYLGWTNTALWMAARVGEEAAAEAGRALSDQLARRVHDRPLRELQTYPGETYPPDISTVIASLALDGRYPEEVASLLARFRADAIDPDTGLVRQTLDPRTGAPGRARGSGTTVSAWFLGHADPGLSRELSAAARATLRDDVLGFGGVREVPAGTPGVADIDSGPVLFGLSVSASGFGLAAARRLGDDAWHRELYRSAHLAGVEHGGWFVLGGSLGNAILLAQLTSPKGVTVPKTSAGLLCYRHVQDRVEVLIVHPGGPFFEGREEGVWTLPKGELDPGEEPLDAAFREFAEETGFPAPDRSTILELGTIRQKSGKIVHGYAVRHDVDPGTLVSGTFELEWPRKSGRIEHFPEVDRAAWTTPEHAATLLNPAQVDFLTRLKELLDASTDP